jgi:alpha-glucuronidase
LASVPVKLLVGGNRARRGGLIAEAGVGRDRFWLGHPLSMANLYAFGRLAWNPDLATKDIAEEWTRLTFGHDPTVVGTTVDLLMKSRRVYENYTWPLGIGATTNGEGSAYGPHISETTVRRQGGGADATRIGYDRTLATGSGFIGQYPPSLAATYESLESCPDDLLLFMHRVPYGHVLKSGKTVIQHMYDAHYQGARDAARAVEKWRRLEGLVDEPRFRDVLARLEYQSGHAQVWRDAVCNWLARTSGVEDGEDRVGGHAKRVEAEAMRLIGYEVREANPWESASAGEYVECTAADLHGELHWKYKGKAGWMDIGIWYFDESDGASYYQLFVGEHLIDEWTADLMLGDDEPNGDTATRRRVARVALRPGDELTIVAAADGNEGACLDYVEIVASE